MFWYQENKIIYPIIGITGQQGNGKDTLADIFVNLYSYTKKSFACSLKQGVCQFFGFSEEQSFGRKKDDKDIFWGITPREAYQKIGTEVFRNIQDFIPSINVKNGNFWVKRMERELLKTKNLVISDVRFLNEAAFIKKNGGIIIRIVRPGFENDSIHSSERELFSIKEDILIVNNGSKNDLRRKIRKMFH